MNILFFGDIVGRIGIEALKNSLSKLSTSFNVDFVIANGENASKGKGLTEKDCFEILNSGVDVITLGNHYLSKDQIIDYIDDVDSLICPVNLLNFKKGRGSEVFSVNGIDVRVTNVLGQGLMKEEVKSPFDSLDELLNNLPPCIHIVDFHGESTSEKKCFGYYLDGRVTAVVGTHTHVQTNDDTVFEKGTGFISDVGMCGAVNSVIGFSKESVIDKFVYKNDCKISINEEDDMMVNAVLICCDDESYECLDIQKINKVYRRN